MKYLSEFIDKIIYFEGSLIAGYVVHLTQGQLKMLGPLIHLAMYLAPVYAAYLTVESAVNDRQKRH